MHWSFSSSFWATLDGRLQKNNCLDNPAFKDEIVSTSKHFTNTGIFFNPTRVKQERIRDYMFNRSAANSISDIPSSFSQSAHRDLLT